MIELLRKVFLNSDNNDLLKDLLEFILNIKIDEIMYNKTELLSGNVKDKRTDIIVKNRNKIIKLM